MARSKRILSIDGGGVRGIIPACALAELEEQTQKQARDIFSFMAGTSTGSIIVAALALGIPAAEIVNLYRDKVGQVFRGNLWSEPLEFGRRVCDVLADAPWWNAVPPIYGTRLPSRLLKTTSTYLDVGARLPGYAYSSTRIHRFVAQAMREKAHVDPELVRLDDLGVDILIAAHGLHDGHTWYFVKSKVDDYDGTDNKKYRTTGDLKLIDCVTGSSSAPTYFTPWPINEKVWRDERLIGDVVDGGVTTANNPVYQACVEAFEYTPEHDYTPVDTLVVSLGTGRRSTRQPIEVGNTLVDWLYWSFDTLLESPGRQQLELVHRHYAETALYRIDVSLPERIDIADPHAITELEDHGRKLREALRDPCHNWHSILAGDDSRWCYERQREENSTLIGV